MELLVASTIALIVMGAVASLFGVFSRAGTNSQSVVDMSNRMRSTANRLRQDLAGLTATLTPPLNPESNAGYFELIEGPWTDSTDGSGNLITATSTTSILADTDDALLFTTRSSASPFEGNYNGNQIESSTAEVAWFCRPSATQPVAGLQLQTLYRRQLLIVGYVGSDPFFTSGSPTNNQVTGSLPAIYSTYDISLRSDPTVGALVPNTLGDLSRRENRFFHDVVTGTSWSRAFPDLRSGTTWLTFDGTTREGEDVVLTNVIGFDVRVFDPDARPKISGSTVVYPNEQTYSTLSVTGSMSAAASKGCFLDLGKSVRPTVVPNVLVPDAVATGTFSDVTALSGIASLKSTLTATYDTWSTSYENNGLNDDNDTEDINKNGTINAGEDLNGNGLIDPLVDEGTDGLDLLTIDTNSDGIPDTANGIPDDTDEKETAPPYAKSLQAIEIRIRCYDPTSREVRQVTVRQTFTN